jgi:hypothetical protein
MTPVVFFLRHVSFQFHEPPKFLSQGKDVEVIEVLDRIAKFNRAAPSVRICSISMPETLRLRRIPVSKLLQKSTRVCSRTSLASSKHLSLKSCTILLVIALILSPLALVYRNDQHVLQGDCWSFNLAGIPSIILLRKNVGSRQDIVTDTYRAYLHVYLIGIVGISSIALGRKKVVTCLLCHLSMS